MNTTVNLKKGTVGSLSLVYRSIYEIVRRKFPDKTGLDKSLLISAMTNEVITKAHGKEISTGRKLWGVVESKLKLLQMSIGYETARVRHEPFSCDIIDPSSTESGNEDLDSFLETLSGNEFHVFNGMREGQRQSQICETTGLTQPGVSKIKERLFSKYERFRMEALNE